MKRSFINTIIRDAKEFLKSQNFHLPAFAHWKPSEQWAEYQKDYNGIQEIIDAQLGWDITDFGASDFNKFGLVLFTIRNGRVPSSKGNPCAYPTKSYCEKAMICRPNQMTPLHYHWHKTEDIICRAGAALVLQLYNADKTKVEAGTETSRPLYAPDTESDVTVHVDGVARKIPAGGKVVLKPGESITIPPFLYHRFWAEEEEGARCCLIGEVSLVNDDDCDNKFADPIGRFPTIVEDEPPAYLITKDYPSFFRLN